MNIYKQTKKKKKKKISILNICALHIQAYHISHIPVWTYVESKDGQKPQYFLFFDSGCSPLLPESLFTSSGKSV